MLGICSVCEEKVSIERSAVPSSQLDKLGYADWEKAEFGESLFYICLPHGEPCEGSGQIPQVVLKN